MCLQSVLSICPDCPDCDGDLHLVVHWEWLCQIRTEGPAVSPSSLAPDQAKSFGKQTSIDPCDSTERTPVSQHLCSQGGQANC